MVRCLAHSHVGGAGVHIRNKEESLLTRWLLSHEVCNTITSLKFLTREKFQTYEKFLTQELAS